MLLQKRMLRNTLFILFALLPAACVVQPGYRHSMVAQPPSREPVDRWDYYYYPDVEVYYSYSTGYYYYYNDGRWISSLILPSRFVLDNRQRVKIHVKNERPYLYHDEYRAKYRPQKPSSTVIIHDRPPEHRYDDRRRDEYNDRRDHNRDSHYDERRDRRYDERRENSRYDNRRDDGDDNRYRDERDERRYRDEHDRRPETVYERRHEERQDNNRFDNRRDERDRRPETVYERRPEERPEHNRLDNRRNEPPRNLAKELERRNEQNRGPEKVFEHLRKDQDRDHGASPVIRDNRGQVPERQTRPIPSTTGNVLHERNQPATVPAPVKDNKFERRVPPNPNAHRPENNRGQPAAKDKDALDKMKRKNANKPTREEQKKEQEENEEKRDKLDLLKRRN